MELWRVEIVHISFTLSPRPISSGLFFSYETFFFCFFHIPGAQSAQQQTRAEMRGETGWLMYEVSIIYVSQVINFRSLQTIENNK